MAVDFIGPTVASHVVAVDGYRVPYLTANPTNATRTEWELVLDGRFSLTVKHDDIEPVVWFIANAIAVGAGYNKHGDGSEKRNLFATKVGFMDAIPDDGDSQSGKE